MRHSSVIGVAGIVVLSCFAPHVAIILLGAALVLQCAAGLLHTLAGCGDMVRRVDEGTIADHDLSAPFFSVHVPIHDEPPSVVIRTLASLEAQIGAPRHEIIVIDNNTSDRALWRPVETWCAAHRRFRFFHYDNVEGAKAGALNIALAQTDPQATHIVTVDSDYVVSADFLDQAAAALARWHADFLQFPQAYVGASIAAGPSLELSDYFRRHARTANGADAMLLTGTLSVISKSALISVGAWRADTVTEDAELGLRLSRRGYRGRFVEQEVGRGLLPFDMLSLHRQRYRWTAGNVRTLMTGLRGLGFARTLQVVSQLTAWANTSLIFAAGLVGATFGTIISPEATVTAGLLATAGLAACYLSMLGPLAIAAFRDGLHPRTLAGAMASRVALTPAAGLATLDSLLGNRPSFNVTSKSLTASGGGLPMATIIWAAIGLALLGLSSAPATVLGGAMMMLPFPAGLFTDRRLRLYRSSLIASEV